ncbi:MAG TPA: aldo/keto reductase [Acidimicrobiales bacterium]|nr:aldo/keto reductase [Acidimicrobiales bacterium]
MNSSRRDRPLGRSGITVPALGIGTNRWGSGAADQNKLDDSYRTALDTGMGFIDTAEVYNSGKSEKAIKAASQKDGRPVVLASKFAPFPYRLTPAQLTAALDRTLERLGRDSIDLYYLHFPFSPRGLATWMEPMARAVKEGKIRAVGVSNCNSVQMRKAAAVLARHDVPLAANQVQYSVAHRKPESNGVLQACRDMDVALVAYRPIGGGPTAGSKANEALREVAERHGATTSQVALAWLLKRGDHVIPIPGATRPEHVRENAGALDLELTPDDIAAIDAYTV